MRVIGGLDHESCGDLRRTVLEALGRQPKRILLDLAAVAFIDTSGIGTLVGLHKNLQSQSIGLILANPSPCVREVLKMTRLLDVFAIRNET